MSFPMTQLMADALFKKQQLIAFNNLFSTILILSGNSVKPLCFAIWLCLMIIVKARLLGAQ